jgi:hypothetical protein
VFPSRFELLLPTGPCHFCLSTIYLFSNHHRITTTLINYSIEPASALLVDALGKSRAEGFRKREAESNVCFISGITREEYEKEGLTTSFDVHIHDTHNPFMYVAYVAYLKKKPRQRLTGMEEHILDQIDGCLPWTPLRTSHAIEIRRKEKGHYGSEAKST